MFRSLAQIKMKEVLWYVQQQGLLTVLYVLLGLLSYVLTQSNDVVTANLFIPEGESLAIALVYGLRIWPSVFMGQWILHSIHHIPAGAALLASMANVIELFFAVMLLRRLGFRPMLATSRDFMLLAFVEAIALQPLSTLLGMMVLWLTGMGEFYLTNLVNIVDYLSLYQAISQILFVATVLVIIDTVRFPRGQSYWLSLGVVILGMGSYFELMFTFGKTWGLTPLHMITVIYFFLLVMSIAFDIVGAVLANLLLLAYMKYSVLVGTFSSSPLGDITQQGQHADIFIIGVLLSTGLIGALQRERNQYIAALKETAIRDYLTGLYNRRYFYELAQRELGRLKRKPMPLSLLCIDIDFFKQINDRFGHAIGDQALQLWAGVLKNGLRSDDVAVRMGGEEFVILVEGDSSASRVAKKLMLMLDDALKEGVIPAFTVSIGTTSINQEDSDIDVALSRGDAALYEAKRRGRNRVVSFEELNSMNK